MFNKHSNARMSTKFQFFKSNYTELFAICELSEQLYFVDASSSLSKSRLFSEKLAKLIWKFEDLPPFNGTQVERIEQLLFRNYIPDIVKVIFHSIRKSGNKATHGSSTQAEALFVLKNVIS